MDKLTCVYDKGFFNRLRPLGAIPSPLDLVNAFLSVFRPCVPLA